MSKSIIEALDWSMPSHTLNESSATTLVRARILVAFYYANTGITAITALTLLFMNLGTDLDLHREFRVALFAFLILAGQMLLFRRFGSVETSGMIYTMVYFLITLTAVITSGGWESPVIMLYFLTPAMAFLVVGRAQGLFTTILVCLSGLILVLASRHNYEVWYIFQLANLDLLRLVMWILSISLLAISLLGYEALLDAKATEK